ncbi:cytochrome P450 709B2-like [Phragmites australis]|uniref:cytochrome P450 709B2-like n=1 Tax=Phragmites australis TaxID=29695 RepID=UPI002D7726FB|nr:cytochrome P450 709B2-like [Phragmites australis]
MLVCAIQLTDEVTEHCVAIWSFRAACADLRFRADKLAALLRQGQPRPPAVWGEDAGEFNGPLRFDGGATKQAPKHLSALLSFSSGPRACIGQNFAMIEVRGVVAAILQRFSLSLSPKYVHAPTDVITLRPKYGLPMIVSGIEA